MTKINPRHKAIYEGMKMSLASITPEQRFRAAVNIVRSMPKSGSFQPSHQLQLKFYSYYKQATQGPCRSGRPSFWDLVGRAKYDAWAALGDMGKEEAMSCYVNEFVNVFQELEKNATREQIEEAMSTENDTVVESMIILGPLLAEKGIKRVKDHYEAAGEKPTGPPPITTNGGTHYSSDDDIEKIPNDLEKAGLLEANGGKNGGGLDSEGEYEEFSDTNEHLSDQSDTMGAKQHGGGEHPPTSSSGIAVHHPRPANVTSRAAGWRWQGPPGTGGSMGGYGGDEPPRRRGPGVFTHELEVGEQLAVAVLRLQRTMDLVVARLDTLEALLQQRHSRSFRSWRVSPYLLAAIFGWPIVVQIIMMILRRRSRQGQVFMKLL